MVQLFVRRISAPVIFIDVEPACTIAEIKALIARDHGIPKGAQRFILSGAVPADTETVASLDLTRESALMLLINHDYVEHPEAAAAESPAASIGSMHLIFKVTATGSQYTVNCDPTEEFVSIRAKLSDMCGAPVEKIRLLHAGTPIKDTDTPTSIDASASTVLHMVLIMWATTPVLFKCMPSGDVITLNCGGKQSFKSIRQQLATEKGSTPDKVRIVHGGKSVNDEDTPESLELGASTCLHVIFRP